MKSALLDTHAFLWFVFDDPRLSNTAEEIISNEKVEKYLSIASLWEIAIKQQIGKLKLGMEFKDFLVEFVMGREIEILSIEPAHLIAYSCLPLHHRDPFDRLLAAQARTAKLPVLSADKSFGLYDVAVSW